ncbi:hypothetical protein LAZ67_12003551 [Cordylochernes scorpioides]|uniref:Uncharacterized protein n=1 Tax=Cordylochernes scorpioides TaxID=51811 RepID=A0ABY6L5X9_9ARAC|nr:hypothetical protein LAZ67_12003551 [Cordylochernes scorpioides]
MLHGQDTTINPEEDIHTDKTLKSGLEDDDLTILASAKSIIYRYFVQLSWDILAHPVSEGGIGLLDISSQLRLSYLKEVQTPMHEASNSYSWLVHSRV